MSERVTDDSYAEAYDAEMAGLGGYVAAEFACALANKPDGPRIRWADYDELVEDGLFLVTAMPDLRYLASDVELFR